MDTRSGKAPRASGIELLRIIAIMMVVAVHYLNHGGVVEASAATSANATLADALQSLVVVGVNCFVLITGYFGVTSKGLNVRRIVNLVLTVAFLSVLCYIVGVLMGVTTLSVGSLLTAFVPYLRGEYWFIKVYLLLALLAPFLNYALSALSKKQYRALCILLLAVFSVWPSFYGSTAFTTDGGFGIIHFVVLYVIGGYLRLHLAKKPPVWLCLIGYAGFAGLTFLCSQTQVVNTYYNYDFVCNIASSVLLFLAFAQLKFQSRAVNFAAQTALGIYILNDNYILKDWIYQTILHTQDYYASSYMIVHFAVCVLLWMVVGFVINIAQIYLFKVTVNPLLDKVGFLNKRYFAPQK